MEKSTVYVSMRDDNNLDCSYSIVQKDELKIIIILRDMECGIFDYNNLEDFKYLLLKHYPDDEVAYKDFLKLIGKMCKKSKESKYFLNHKNEDNRIIYINLKNEHTINDAEREENEYKMRYSDFEKFVKDNAKNF